MKEAHSKLKSLNLKEHQLSLKELLGSISLFVSIISDVVSLKSSTSWTLMANVSKVGGSLILMSKHFLIFFNSLEPLVGNSFHIM